MIARVKL